MKHLLKHPSHFMKLIALLLFFSVFNCQKEDINTPNQTQELSSVSYKIISLSKLTKLQPVVENIKKLSPKSNAYNRGFGDVLPLENIDTTRVIQYTDTTGYSTYTFKIDSDDETSINFENLCLLETEQGYIAYILSYEPDENWYFSEDNYTPEGDHVFNIPTYQGDITKYSLEREVIWSTKEENMNRTTHSMRGSFVEVCVYSTYQECCNNYPGNPTGACHPRGARCQGPFKTTSSSSCQMVWSGGGSGNEGDGSGDGDGSNNGGGDGNNPCITSGTTIIDDQPISGIGTGCTPNEGTGVLIDTDDEDTPCEKLNQLAQTDSLSVNIKPIIDSLRTKTLLDKEYSISFKKTMHFGQVRSSADPIGLREGASNTSSKIRIGPYWFGQAHTHPIGTFGMYSWNDIMQLRNLYSDLSSTFKNEAFIMIVNHDGTVYALKVNDFNKLNVAINNDLNDTEGITTDEKVKILNDEIQKEFFKDPDNLERVFLTEFGNYDVSIYKAADENLSSWNKLKLDASNLNNIEVNEIPCN